MEQILHRHHAGKIGKHGYTIISTIRADALPKGTFLSIIKNSLNPLTPLPAVVQVGDCDMVFL